MRAMTWHGGSDFSLDRTSDLKASVGEVIVKVDTVGVCGTDVHITQGLFPATPPKVLGHEGSGTIVSIGEGVDANRIGERVAMNTTSHCGECSACITWSQSRCQNTYLTSGMFAEYATAPSQSAVKIPDTLDLEPVSYTHLTLPTKA